MDRTSLAEKTSLNARAFFLGERIDVRALESAERIGSLPLMIAAGEAGAAVLFRYGAVVLFDLQPVEEMAFLESLRPLIRDPFSRPETEHVQVSVDPARPDQVDGGVVFIPAVSVERLQIIADILAKSVVLAYYEAGIAQAFDRIEPLAMEMSQRGRGWHKGKDLVRQIGSTLLINHKMVGRVEVAEKPDLLWDHPGLERLYARLVDEFELVERHLALGRKLELASRTTETLLNLLQNNRTLRVEWYIVILIVIEILLSLYELFIRK